MGYRIFVLCLKQLFVNWKVALRLSWFWALVFVVADVGMLTTTGPAFVNMTGDGGDNGMAATSSLLFLPIWLGFFFAFMIGHASIAIGWHRYVLRGEIPRSPYFFPAPKTLWPYIWRGIKIGLMLLVIMIPLGAVLMFVMTSVLPGMFAQQPSGAVPTSFLVTSMLGILLIMTPAVWFYMRLALGLPGTAIGQDIRSSASWKITGPFSGALFSTALLVSALLAIPDVLDVLIGAVFQIQPSDSGENVLSASALFQSLLLVPISVGFIIISLLVSVGVQTVIYGHLQEGRSI